MSFSWLAVTTLWWREINRFRRQRSRWVSALTQPFQVTAPTAVIAERAITATLPLRIIGLNSRSGYSTARLGFRPFDISTAPIDHVKAEAVLERDRNRDPP